MPGTIDEHLEEQEPLPGRPPTPEQKRKRAAKVIKNAARRAQIARVREPNPARWGYAPRMRKSIVLLAALAACAHTAAQPVATAPTNPPATVAAAAQPEAKAAALEKARKTCHRLASSRPARKSAAPYRDSYRRRDEGDPE